MLAMAPPLDADKADAAPQVNDIVGFQRPGGVAVLLVWGNWHAGPYFRGDSMAFFNPELADTNVVDHHAVDLPIALLLVETD